MSRFMALSLAALLMVASLPGFADTPAAQLPPDQLVQQTATSMLDAVASRKAELQKDPPALYKLVGDTLLPHFDFARASQLVLGLNWRNATDAQKKAFQDAFYKYLVHSYADALLKGDYSGHNIQVDPYRPGGNPDQATVKTRVLRDNGPPVQVDYVLERTPDGWKAFDVVIEGISYVLNYRNQFAPEIQQKGLDELIKRLNDDADKSSAAKPAGGN